MATDRVFICAECYIFFTISRPLFHISQRLSDERDTFVDLSGNTCTFCNHPDKNFVNIQTPSPNIVSLK